MAELQARMTSREFTEWQAYLAHEPHGAARADRRVAVLTAAIINMAPNDGKRAAVSPQDVLDDYFDFWPAEPVIDPETGEEVFTEEEKAAAEAALLAWAAEMGAR